MADNHAMQHVSKKAGFRLTAHPGDREYVAEYDFDL